MSSPHLLSPRMRDPDGVLLGGEVGAALQVPAGSRGGTWDPGPVGGWGAELPCAATACATGPGCDPAMFGGGGGHRPEGVGLPLGEPRRTDRRGKRPAMLKR